jgi:mRNA interferase MazF
MGRFVKGEVVVIPFPFTDFTNYKKRPALVVSLLTTHDDLILCMITSQLAKDRDALPLLASDFISGALSRPSNIRPNRLFTVNEQRVLSSVGLLTPTKLQMVIDKIVDIVRR